MKAGDTILIAEPGTSNDSHLWMVISDPEQDAKCLIVNFTSWRADKDQACVIEYDEHPYVNTRLASIIERQSLCQLPRWSSCLIPTKLLRMNHCLDRY